MRAAVIGTGLIAHNHAQALRQQGHELFWVVSRRLTSAKQFALQYGCEHYSDALTEEVLQNVDVVHICTPPGDHFAYAKAALEAGKAVFCEKPLTFSSEEAEELCRIAEKTGALAAVNFNNRFYPACEALKQELYEEGPVRLVHGHYRQEFQSMPAPWSWRYTDPYRASTEIGSHFVDLVRYLTDLEVESLSAVFATFRPERRVCEGMMVPDGDGETVTVTNEDAVALTMRLDSGAVASVFLSEVNPGRGNDISIEIICDDAALEWQSEDPYAVYRGRKGEGVARVSNPFAGGFSTTFVDSVCAFYASVENGGLDGRLASLRDGLAAVKICEAMKRSAEQNGAFVTV